MCSPVLYESSLCHSFLDCGSDVCTASHQEIFSGHARVWAFCLDKNGFLDLSAHALSTGPLLILCSSATLLFLRPVTLPPSPFLVPPVCPRPHQTLCLHLPAWEPWDIVFCPCGTCTPWLPLLPPFKFMSFIIFGLR